MEERDETLKIKTKEDAVWKSFSDPVWSEPRQRYAKTAPQIGSQA